MSEPGARRHREFGPRSVRRDVDDEIAYHLEMRREEYRQRGLDDRAAHEAAERRFGDTKSVRAMCYAIGNRWEREKRRASVWADLRYDLRHALRSLRRTPGFTVVAVATLTLGIAAATAMFSVVNAVLLRPLPYADADRLVFLWSTRAALAVENLTPGRFVDFRERARSLTTLAGFSHVPMNLTDGDLPERLSGVSVSTDFFDVLAVKALVGRTFLPADDGVPVAVLSHGVWLRRYGADPSIVGRRITLNRTPYLVAGVLPPEFIWPSVVSDGVSAAAIDIFVAPAERQVPGVPAGIAANLVGNRSVGYIRAVARLRPGVTLKQAQAEMDGIAADLAREHLASEGLRGARLVPMRTQYFGDVRRPLGVLTGAVVLVVIIACANLASLLLGRASARRHELAVRAALGASRGRVVRQMLTEATALSLCSGVLGMLLAGPATRWLVTLGPRVLRLDASRVDWPALVFAVALALVTGLAFGLVPALHASRRPVRHGLQHSERTTAGSARRLRDTLVVAQLAMSIVLLVGAGLLLRSFQSLREVDLGIEVPRLLTFGVSSNGPRAESVESRSAFYDELLEQVRSVPGVRAAAAAVTLPVGGDTFGIPVVVEGQQPAEGERRAGLQIVSPGYFEVMGIRLLRGRDFNRSDSPAGAPVVIVSRRFAEQYWPGAETVGRRVRLSGSASAPWMTVVGVAGNVRHEGPQAPERAEVYRPSGQAAMSFTVVVVRTTGDPQSVVPDVRRAVARVDPTLPLADLATMEQKVAESVGQARFMSMLVSMFGVLAVVLAAVGLYASLAYLVGQRQREIGIRMALGAARPAVVSLVLRQSVRLVAAGVIVGLGAGALGARAIGGLLFGVEPLDPLTFALVPAGLVAVALAATAVPLARALRINPIEALRAE